MNPHTRHAALLAGACLLAAAMGAHAGAESNEESVDRLTKSALALDANRQHGGAVYREVCAKCHGPTAHGDSARAIPALAGQRFAYLVRQLANFSGDERDSTAMHRIIAKPPLRDPQAWTDVAAYLNAAPVARLEATGDGLHLGLGRGIFHEQCASCHRADARGDDDGFAPSLRNQHFSYLAAQMRKLGEGARHNVDENLVRFIGSLEERDITAVADYLSRLRGPGGGRRKMRPDGVVVD